ncbi:MAG TPA: D-alanine--D-alanine ligase [Syntrophorhabdaceae bacterium]|nr:D-alanine--D-alanine ligase [Syntrophorhabdaceae bacterium]
MDNKVMRKKKIGVLFGGRSSERKISLKSGNAVLQSLQRMGYNAVGIDVTSDLASLLIEKPVDVAFIALHGRWGEDGTVQGMLEVMGVPYTGTGVLGSSMAMNKIIMKLVLEKHRIPTPRYQVIRTHSDISMPAPYVVKPPNEGSSVGVSIVDAEGQSIPAVKKALRYDKSLLVEEYVKGQEITVAVINGVSLPAVEVRPKSGFYDIDAKYKKGKTEYLVPAPLGSLATKRATELALKIYDVFQLSGSARIDMIVHNKTPFVIDINTSPGMTETSLVPKAWNYTGRTFDQLVEEILKGAQLKV